MEEILASIRRIIADDEGGAKPVRSAEPPVTPRPPEARAPEAPHEPEPVMAEAENGQADADAPLAPAAPLAAAEEPVEDVLEPTPDLRASLSLRPSIDSVEPRRRGEPPVHENAVFEESGSRRPGPEPRPRLAEAPAAQPETTPERLLSAATDQAVATAFSGLSHLIVPRDARTLEDLVQEMLRPLLKSWLDDNLPRLVERLVRAEIERVSRDRR